MPEDKGARPEPRWRKRSARLEDIARVAGVSVATVDRVFNGRESVSPANREKVIMAARTLGVPRSLPRVSHALVHFDVLLPPSETPFFIALRAALDRFGGMLDKRIVLHRSIVPEVETKTITRLIRAPAYRRQGLILAAPDDPGISQAVVEAMQGGEPVTTIVTTLAGVPDENYFGIDNYEAGATAGHVMARMVRGRGRVLLVGPRRNYQGHKDRQQGFMDALAGIGAVTLEIGDLDTNDDPVRCYSAVHAAAGGGAPLVGIYNSGAGSQGIQKALQAVSRPEDVVWITHEFSADHQAYLRQGWLDMVIDQDPEQQISSALQYLLFRNGMLENQPVRAGNRGLRLFFPTNVPLP